MVVNMLTLKPSDIPRALDLLPPKVEHLFYEGPDMGSWINSPKLAVVGSRRPTAYGRETTQRIVSDLARAGVVIISGLALGIDGIAHRAALNAGGTTIAVLPSGIKQIYPRSHQALASQIIDSGGGLLSEYSEYQMPYKHSFIARNRLIAGFSDGILITEAALDSGSLHTAGFGLDIGLPVMAVPGSIYSNLSAGTNRLIKNGAHLVESAEDVMLAIGYSLPKFKSKRQSKLPPEQAEILNLIGGGVCLENDLAAALKTSPPELAVLLTTLEIAGLISPQGAGQWVAI